MRNCGIKNATVETYFSIIIVELAVIIVFVVAAVLGYLNKKDVKNVTAKPNV